MRVKGRGRGATSPPVVHRLAADSGARQSRGRRQARAAPQGVLRAREGRHPGGWAHGHRRVRGPPRAPGPQGARHHRGRPPRVSRRARADPPGTFSGPFRRAREASPRGAGRRDATFHGPDRPSVRSAPPTSEPPPSRARRPLRPDRLPRTVPGHDIGVASPGTSTYVSGIAGASHAACNVRAALGFEPGPETRALGSAASRDVQVTPYA